MKGEKIDYKRQFKMAGLSLVALFIISIWPLLIFVAKLIGGNYTFSYLLTYPITIILWAAIPFSAIYLILKNKLLGKILALLFTGILAFSFGMHFLRDGVSSIFKDPLMFIFFLLNFLSFSVFFYVFGVFEKIINPYNRDISDNLKRFISLVLFFILFYLLIFFIHGKI